MQSWVSKSTVRSISDEPESMQMAAENRRRIMGSSLFGDDPNQYQQQQQQQNFSKTAPLPSIDESYSSDVSPANQPSLSSTLPLNTNPNYDYGTFSSTLGSGSTDFPDINFDMEPPPILNASDLGFKPRQTNYRTNGAPRRLQVPSNQKMRQLRDDLNRETEKFNKKLRQVGQS